MVYFITYPIEACPIKIGYTEDERRLRGRMRALNTSSPWPIKGLALAERAGRATERELHSLLVDHHARGEWFKPTIPVLTVVAYCKANPTATHAEIVEAARVAVGQVVEPPLRTLPKSARRRRSRRQSARIAFERQLEDGSLTIRRPND